MVTSFPPDSVVLEYWVVRSRPFRVMMHGPTFMLWAAGFSALLICAGFANRFRKLAIPPTVIASMESALRRESLLEVKPLVKSSNQWSIAPSYITQIAKKALTALFDWGPYGRAHCTPRVQSTQPIFPPEWRRRTPTPDSIWFRADALPSQDRRLQKASSTPSLNFGSNSVFPERMLAVGKSCRIRFMHARPAGVTSFSCPSNVMCFPACAATFSSSEPEPQVGSYAVVEALLFAGEMPMTLAMMRLTSDGV